VSFAKISVVRQLLCILPLLVTACGGGRSPPPTPANPSIDQFTSDKSSYFVGDQAQLTAVYSNGTARIQPGDITIASGQTITTPTLTTNTTYRLEVVGNGNTANRELALTVSYRERMRAIAVPFARSEHMAVRLNDGRVLVVGGRDESKQVARQIYVFDPSSEAFTAFGSIVTSGPLGSVAVTLADGNVLLVGGIPASAFSNAVLINAQTGAVTPTPSQPHSRRVVGTGTRLADGKVLFVGGLLAAGGNGDAILITTTPDPTAEIYDSATGAFTVLPAALSVGRYGHTAVTANDGRVLVYGGDTENGQAAPPELYDPATGRFSLLVAPESNVRENHSAVKASDGGIWIIGGDDGTQLSALTSVIRFDPASTTFSHALDLATPRTLLGATALADRVLVAGGASDLVPNRIEQSSELIDATTKLRIAGPQMSATRYSFTMTPLSNGKVLILGGLDQDGNPMASAEIYE
jgi:N-acetylneuraminic acid mutarotase